MTVSLEQQTKARANQNVYSVILTDNMQGMIPKTQSNQSSLHFEQGSL